MSTLVIVQKLISLMDVELLFFNQCKVFDFEELNLENDYFYMSWYAKFIDIAVMTTTLGKIFWLVCICPFSTSNMLISAQAAVIIGTMHAVKHFSLSYKCTFFVLIML